MTEIPKFALRARQMHSEGQSVARILRATKISRATLDLWLDGGPADRDGARPLPALQRRGRHGGDGEPPVDSREALIGRLWRTADRQVSEIERRHRAAPNASGQNVRQFAVLVRTLRELTALDQAHGRAMEDDDAGPKDIDEFRNELARKIEGIIAARDSN